MIIGKKYKLMSGQRHDYNFSRVIAIYDDEAEAKRELEILRSDSYGTETFFWILEKWIVKED